MRLHIKAPPWCVRIAGVALLLIAAVALHADDVEVSADCPWIDRQGYTPVVLSIRSLVDAPVEIVATFDNSRASTVIAARAGQRLVRTLLVSTPRQSWQTSITVRWNAGVHGRGTTSTSGAQHRAFELLLIDPSEAVSQKRLADVLGAAVGTPPSPDGSSYGSSKIYEPTRILRLDPSTLPDAWQGYPWWLAVVITPEGERALSDAQRQALARWSHGGGALFATQAEHVERWRASGARAALSNDDALIERIKAVFALVQDDYRRTPVPGTGSVPVTGFISLAVLFAVLVGPANIWWCVRRGRRHLLLITTPLISASFCVLLITWGLLADGLSVRRTAVQALVIDESQTAVAGWIGLSYFSGMTVSPFALDTEDCLTIADANTQRYSYRSSNESEPTELIWDGGQRAISGWIPSRVTRQLALATVRPERRRLTMQSTPAGLTITNGFEAPLRQLSVAAGDSSWLALTEPLAPGATATLRPGALLEINQAEELSGRLPGGFRLALEQAQRQQLRWIGVFDGALLAIPGPTAIDVVPTTTWVAATGAATASDERKGF